jgi:hypothetical protein
VMVPPRIFPYLIVIHTKLGFCFLKALLDGPTHAAEPYCWILNKMDLFDLIKWHKRFIWTDAEFLR